jgi:diguanylate cyclase (GGDEF)-like protein
MTTDHLVARTPPVWAGGPMPGPAVATTAGHDPLTGLPDRVAFRRAVERSLTGLANRRGLVAVLFCDLDRFKSVNDGLGHAVGDHLLRAAAGRIRGALRDGDVVGRAGGDEFTVLLDPVDSLADARHLAERVLAAFSVPLSLDHRLVSVTASIGVAVAASAFDTAADLTADADAALRRAKAAGRNRVVVFDSQLRQALNGRAEQRAALRRAIGTGDIEVHYQPQIDLDSEEIVGAEALARWRHPELGMLAAADFVPLAEEAGLTDALEALVLRDALALARRWRANRGRGPVRPVAVNLSAARLVASDPSAGLAGLIDHLGADPSEVCLELPEAAFAREAVSGTGRLHALRETGVHLAIDDFGGVGSALSLLRHTPADTVKLHRDLVADLGADPSAAAVVRGIVGVAADLGLTVVATGVETKTQADVLRGCGCHRVQGWLFSPARPVRELLA